MKIPPVTVYGKDLSRVKDVLEIHFNVKCVNTVQFDEQVAYVTFNEADTPSIQNFIDSIACGIDISHMGNIYSVTTQYLDI
jgi:hypothetical protein